jgi:hypothetical protein
MSDPEPDPPTPESVVDTDDLRARRLRLVLAGSTLVMVVLSWPLWIDLADFPAVPFVRWFPEYPREWSWLGLGMIVAGLGLGMSDRFGRIGLGVTVITMTWLILGDQLRLQPWVYQFLVMGTLLAVLPSRSALVFCRAYLVSVYIYSGLSKLDQSFVDELGPLFLRTFARLVPIDASGLFKPGREATVLVMPLAEIVVAALLVPRRTRAIGYLGALIVHLSLLLVLGPWGLGHSTIVLAWNVALGVEEFFVFWPGGPGRRESLGWSFREKIVALPFAMVMVMSLTERLGLFDSWPSHALYASHCERSSITMDAFGNFDSLPTALRVASTVSIPQGGWVLNPTDWTRSVRGVPVCPQNRYANGLAEWIAARKGNHGYPRPEVRVVHSSRADLLTGRRGEIRLEDLDDIRDEGDRFWFNAHPRPRVSR